MPTNRVAKSVLAVAVALSLTFSGVARQQARFALKVVSGEVNDPRCGQPLPIDVTLPGADGQERSRNFGLPDRCSCRLASSPVMNVAPDPTMKRRMVRCLLDPPMMDTAALARDVVITVHGDGTIERNRPKVGDLTRFECFFMEVRAVRVQEFVQAMNRAQGLDLSGLHFKLLGTDGDMVFPLIVNGTNNAAPTGNVFIPHRFLADVNVKWELFTFMLLHELGHTQGLDGSPVNEHDADEWALTDGAAQFAAGSGSVIEAFLKPVPEQLQAYHRSQFTPATADLAVDMGDPLNSYPELPCRIAHLRDGSTRGMANGSYRNEYPADCWDDLAIERALDFNAVYVKLSCHPELETFSKDLGRSAGDTLPLLSDVRRRLVEELWWLERLRDPCLVRPDLCKRAPEQVRELLLTQVPGLARRERAAVRRAERLQRRLKRIREDVLKWSGQLDPK